jgi:hypothetical protein
VEQSPIPLATNEVAGLNFTLEVGAASERVQVVAEVPVINTETSETSTLTSTKSVVDLPLNGRNVKKCPQRWWEAMNVTPRR